ncbi:MAG TPA: zf-HC2 domain-containing protein [Myxococcales bacterium]|nr:zf-HC2 domain-containing protein [Myxococcales bacterium]
MTTQSLQRMWPACLSALHLDRWLMGELSQGEADAVLAHVSGCERCRRTVEAMRADKAAADLPHLRLLSIAPAVMTDRQARPSPHWKLRLGAAAACLAAAAAFFIVARPHGLGERIKGPGFALAMYVQHGGEVRRVGPGEAIAPGDAVRFAVSTPVKAYVAVLSVDAKGRASIYYPAGSSAQLVSAGEDAPLPLGTRLDETVGEERVVGLFCSAPVDLEPLRAALEAGTAAFPHECQVTQWTFVKR